MSCSTVYINWLGYAILEDKIPYHLLVLAGRRIKQPVEKCSFKTHQKERMTSNMLVR
jgi:hypothetical protein